MFTHCNSTVHALKNIKNWSHDTIHTFKNYFVTAFLVFSFNKNKFNPNGLIIVEGDCLHVIQALQQTGPCNMLFCHIIDETKRLGQC